ncbi:Uncharacterised protein [Mycobacteroides abscessus]|nr:Uncharacterised protein [Mycobacteroides abscessus]
MGTYTHRGASSHRIRARRPSRAPLHTIASRIVAVRWGSRSTARGV